MLGGTPEAGSKVQPGDTIDIKSMAGFRRPALGVKTLYVAMAPTSSCPSGTNRGATNPWSAISAVSAL